MSARKNPVATMFAPGGPIAGQLARFEARPQQVEMASAIERAFADNAHLIVEAGTGVGKSFAYLLPAILRAVEHKERIVVSTHTIALQEQLIHKDIPFLAKILPGAFEAVLVKGRSNYLGLRRLERTVQQASQLLSSDEMFDELRRIKAWSKTTNEGSLSDLPLSPNGAVWERVRSDTNDCMGRKCPRFEECFYQLARRRMHKAQILVVNHALLMTDLALRGKDASVLPDYHRVILDEAHTVEQAASDYLGLEVSSTQVQFLLNSLYNERTGKGLLATTLLHRQELPLVAGAARAAMEYFEDLADWQQHHGRSNGRLMQPPQAANRLTPALIELGKGLETLGSKSGSEEEKLALTGAASRCAEMAGAIRTLHEQNVADWVYWMEVRSERFLRVTLGAKPIHVGPAMKALLFDRVRSVVLTSATLSAGSGADFGYLRERLGLENAAELKLGSPFDFKRQAVVHVEPAMPDPGDAGAFVEAVCERLQRYLKLTGGRAFVLFTSHAMLRRCAEALALFCREEGFPLFVQGTGMPRSQMLEAFRATDHSVLFGAESFWSGVDLPGEALSNVIIVKLPFSAPDDPLVEARVEQIRKANGNPFLQFQVPEAVLKFRQAVGRLIRTQTDTGIVAILDPRVMTKPYGKQFLGSLPPCRVEVHKG
ncbi:MAG: DEAD/DEAH box helicase family protein [Phycisphaerales bacterium]|nr:DEAD/DEAH box helicase family protein [Phycisphaerales bacterium]